MKNENEMKFIPTVDTSKSSVNEMFGKILQQKIQDGALEKALTEKVDALFASCVQDAFSYNSEIRKAVENAIKNSISPNLKELGDFPKYHQLVMQSIKGAATKFQDEKLQAVIDKEIESVFEKIPSEITLSWVLNEIKEEIKRYESDFEGGELTLIIECSSSVSSYKHIYIGKEEGLEKYECEYQISVDEKGQIFSLKIHSKEAGNVLTVGNLWQFEKKLFNAYTMKSTLILDKGASASNYDLFNEADYEN